MLTAFVFELENALSYNVYVIINNVIDIGVMMTSLYNIIMMTSFEVEIEIGI